LLFFCFFFSSLVVASLFCSFRNKTKQEEEEEKQKEKTNTRNRNYGIMLYCFLKQF